MGRTFTHLNFRASSAPLSFGGLLALLLLLPSFIQAQPVTVTVTGTNVTCNGANNGTATAVGGGGWPPYTYQWSNGATTATVTGLAPGTYSVTATDIDLGYAVGTITITQPTPLFVEASCESQICDIVPDGWAKVIPANGTPPYTYLWSNGQTTPLITGLDAGIYTVTVTDANGCTKADSCEVVFWDEGVWLMDSSSNVTCFGLNNGFSHIGPMSGTPPYTYIWNTGATTQDVFNLAPGTYTVTVTDANGCSNFHVVTITQPPQLLCNASSTPGACGLKGSATVAPSGGTPPYTVLWSTGSTNFTIDALPGTYGVTVTDANDCTCSAMVTIDSTTSSLVVTTTVNSNAGCTIGGGATASASGGTGNYAYSWDNGQMTATATNLTAGNHTVTVIDITTGCTGVGTVNIPAAPPLTATATLVDDADCLMGGSATAAGNGGTPPYSFLWDNGQTTATATNLGAGPHTVTVSDTKGCIVTALVTIGQSQGPMVNVVVNANATCTAGGSATAQPSGGTPPYIYLWDNGQTTATATNLAVGTHKVTVTDAGGCSATGMVNITQPDAPTVQLVNVTNATCVMGGSATVAASGGTPPYSYVWDSGSINATTINLAADDYTVTVTDAAGCTATLTVTIGGPMLPSVIITASANAKCDQPGSATASAVGGAGGYTYLWDNGETTATASNLSAGPHSVTVTDAAGCTATASLNIGLTNNGIKLGDYVWYDNDQDGFQNPLETDGVPNVTVKLIKAGPDGVFGTSDDETVQTTTTNANGKYEFVCVTPGVYIINFSGIPQGYQFTKKDYVNNDCKDSDAKQNGNTDPFTIVAGQTDNLCFDAGIHIFCDNVLNAGTICCNQTICEGETPALIYNVLTPWGGSGTIEYQWLQLLQIGQSAPNWVAIPGATNATYQPGPLFQNAYYMRCARRAGCVTFLESNIVTITVVPAGSSNCPDFTGDLSASLAGSNAVNVQWTTTLPELDQYMYTVQHSTNMVDWVPATNIMGKRDATKPNHYSFLHQTPVMGKNYYRVKRTNTGGLESFSPIRSVDLEVSLTAAVAINPNPVSDVLIIKNVAQYDGDVTVELITTKGEVLRALTIPAGKLHYEELPVAALPSGLYMARIRFPDGSLRTLKITKF
ncbi:MAG: hypothetical protein KIS77_17850 [Saprospiraceae bacterium]|nr:hypothetical protein [Saprospiraceae bacterium]